jgi:hypothetical protein
MLRRPIGKGYGAHSIYKPAGEDRDIVSIHRGSVEVDVCSFAFSNNINYRIDLAFGRERRTISIGLGGAF